DLFKEISTLKRLTKAEEKARIAKLYTDINLDGRFHSLGNNEWGLKKWYTLDQTKEEITTPVGGPQAREEEAGEVDLENLEGFEELEAALEEVAGEESETELEEGDLDDFSDLEAELEEDEED